MLSQTVGYTATALGAIAAASGKPLFIKEIAEAADIPAPYLAKIINTLARKGIVSTQRGIGGGVVLAQDPTKLTLFDLAMVQEGDLPSDPGAFARRVTDLLTGKLG